jgi:glycosyltransferase involved in cell wall biosynthesis
LALVVPGGLHPSGREQVVPSWLSLIERLARRHEVHAFALNHLTEAVTYPLAGATVHDLGQPGGMIAQQRALRRAMRAAGPFDIVHGFFADPAGLMAAAAGRRFGLPSVVTCDSGEFADRPDIGYGLQRSIRGRAIVSLTGQFASCVVVCSAYQERLAREHGLAVERIPLGVDLARFDVRASAAPPAPSATPGFRVLQVATLSPVKGQAVLLEALARAARRVPQVHLDLVGQDTLGGAIQAQARSLGLEHRVTFHGFVSHEDLPALYRRADVYVQSSHHEAAGAVVLEAAAAGLPIVGTGVGFVADWSADAALAVPDNDAPALAEALVTVLTNQAERARLAAAARRRVRDYDADVTTRQLEACYARIAHRQGGAGQNDAVAPPEAGPNDPVAGIVLFSGRPASLP